MRRDHYNGKTQDDQQVRSSSEPAVLQGDNRRHGSELYPFVTDSSPVDLRWDVYNVTDEG
ncbi:MAG: hypothetical protein OXC62_15445 [Aestuariivita sp.]|nr:hypothetical protein [Aestuariivita sp.]